MATETAVVKKVVMALMVKAVMEAAALVAAQRICQYILELETFQSNLYGPDFSAT